MSSSTIQRARSFDPKLRSRFSIVKSAVSISADDETEGCVLYNKRYWDMIDVEGGRFVMGHTHNFFDYLDDYQTRYLLDTRHWIKLDAEPLEVIEE